MQQTFPNPAMEAAPHNLVAEGERLFGEGLIKEARELFWQAAENCPGNAQAWNNLAVAALAEGRDKEAETHLRQALEVKSDFVEARYNLAEIHLMRRDWAKAARELSKILEYKPDDLPTIKRLAQAHMAMGDAEKARQILESSGNMGAMKAFINSLWLGIKYYSMAEDLSPAERLEKFTASVLKLLDGQDGRSHVYRLVTRDHDLGRDVALEGFYDAFYYQERPGIKVAADQDKPELILTIGEHEDWENFRAALRVEMKAEGGCLGDFTQTKKVLKREGGLSKYDIPATLKYFQDNVGPCDCHVLRAVLV